MGYILTLEDRNTVSILSRWYQADTNTSNDIDTIDICTDLSTSEALEKQGKTNQVPKTFTALKRLQDLFSVQFSFIISFHLCSHAITGI